jgi:hypothetical protein
MVIYGSTQERKKIISVRAFSQKIETYFVTQAIIHGTMKKRSIGYIAEHKTPERKNGTMKRENENMTKARRLDTLFMKHESKCHQQCSDHARRAPESAAPWA